MVEHGPPFVGVAVTNRTHLGHTLASVGFEASESVGRIRQIGTVSRMQDGGTERAEAAERCEVVRDAAFVFTHPSGVPMTQDQIPAEEGPSAPPPVGDVISGMARGGHDLDQPCVGRQAIPLTDGQDGGGAPGDEFGSFRCVRMHGRTCGERAQEHGETLQSRGMIRVLVRYGQSDLLCISAGLDDRLEMLVNGRARVDDEHVAPPDDPCTGTVEGERPRVGCDELTEGRCVGAHPAVQRRSCAICSASLSAMA